MRTYLSAITWKTLIMDANFPNPYIETRILHKLLIPQKKEKIAAEPMGATNIFSFSCETNILHIISRFYVGIWEFLLVDLMSKSENTVHEKSLVRY